jgi:hypothetical protein
MAVLRSAAVLAALFLALPTRAQVSYQTLPGDQYHRRMAMPGLVWDSRIVIEDKPCCETPPGAASPDDQEARVMAEIPGQALREGRVLELRLDGFRTLKITDCDDLNRCGNAAFRTHRVVAWWPGTLRTYVINVRVYEGEMAFLVRAGDGSVTIVARPPILSPNARYAISWDPSLMNGPAMELLDLARHTPAIHVITPERVCRDEQVHPGRQPVWLSDTKVAFDDSTLGTATSPRFRLTLQIVADTNLRWECHF